MDDFTTEVFTDQAAWSVLEVLGNLSIQHYLLGIAALFVLFCLVRHKRIMAEVRASFLRVHTLILGVIYAIMALGVYKSF